MKDQLKRESEQEVQELRLVIKKREQEHKRKKMKASLSFLNEEDEEAVGEPGEEQQRGEQSLPMKKKKIAKNPDVDTSHLPDRERDARLQEERERLTQEWLAQQEIIKNQVCPPLSAPSVSLSLSTSL
jgi:protein FAM50